MATDRLQTEQHFHDQQALRRATTFQQEPQTFVFDDALYLDHETWIRPAFRLLGDVGGLNVLDLGCGHGMAAVVLARHGATVTALDLSPGYVTEASQRALANEVDVSFLCANGEKLPFSDHAFDRVWGNAVLHHLDLAKAGKEILRVLRPGGVAVFCEPWGENFLLNWARHYFPYPGKERTPEERPLMEEQVDLLRKIFPDLRFQGFQLFSMVRRVLPKNRWIAYLDQWDRRVLGRIPALQRHCRYVVLTMKRPFTATPDPRDN